MSLLTGDLCVSEITASFLLALIIIIRHGWCKAIPYVKSAYLSPSADSLVTNWASSVNVSKSTPNSFSQKSKISGLTGAFTAGESHVTVESHGVLGSGD